MGRAKIFWNLMANHYSKSTVSDVDGYEKTLTLTRKYLKKDSKVLEIGCGTGTSALKLAGSVDRMEATDISKNMIAIAQKKAKDQGISNIQFFTSTLDDPKLKKNSYDVIIAFNLIHLLSNTDQSLKKISGLLKPGGLFISKTPCLGEKASMRVLALFIRLLIGPITCFTVDEFKSSMKKTGFEAVEDYQTEEQPPRLVAVVKKA